MLSALHGRVRLGGGEVGAVGQHRRPAAAERELGLAMKDRVDATGAAMVAAQAVITMPTNIAVMREMDTDFTPMDSSW